MEQVIKAEYIWLDGAETQKLRSKTKILPMKAFGSPLTDWSFDGSSTFQSEGSDSDLILRPVKIVKDPTRYITVEFSHVKFNHMLVLCEVMEFKNAKITPHRSNTRAKLREVLNRLPKEIDPWIGFEQEYTLINPKTHRPLGFPDAGLPEEPQGMYYCGVGSDEVVARDLVEEHLDACLSAGLMMYGVNAEVMPGQWEFQIGYRGIEGENANPLAIADELWLARYLLYKIGEKYGISATLDCKPFRGDWNGAGMHTNFSTSAMREMVSDDGVIPLHNNSFDEAIDKLRDKHSEHIDVYGAGLANRLTGEHETCRIDEFRSGVADRGASIRIPRHVAAAGSGYLEDRRPGANADPYVVSAMLVETICL